tara:strand:+ start:1345 stop:1698 length:354 start_codon:yes stop_codon:yes gene_type:complete
MAHFAKLGTGNIVEKVIVVHNNDAPTEQAGINFINNLYNTNDIWKQTSYNATIRKNFAGIGFKYNEIKDAFIPPRPFNSWILNETTCQWEAPITRPTGDLAYVWNETTKTWDQITFL